MSRPAIAAIHLAHLRHNYRLLQQLASSARLMAVVKADAYGHGMHLVAPVLFEEGCRKFAVTDAAEGAVLRRLLGDKAAITVLSGVFDDEDARLCQQARLQPVIFARAQLEQLQRQGFAGKAWLKVDSGMHRLGAEDAAQLAAAIAGGGIRLAGVMSHLACAEQPDHPLNPRQVAHFTRVMQAMPKGTAGSLLNSAGLAAMPQHAFDVVRPGIALYGVEPLPGRTLGLQPVMKLSGRIMQVRKVAKGEGLSYGASFIAPRNMRVAVVCLGYADGLPRLLSNRGWAVCGDVRLAIVGRVCMDYCLLDAGDVPLQAGDAVEFWGEALPASEVAQAAGTIPYELFTHVHARVRRVPVEATA